jgi:hypothetical protein
MKVVKEKFFSYGKLSLLTYDNYTELTDLISWYNSEYQTTAE